MCQLIGGLAVLFAPSPAAATVERPDIKRYEVILSRRPFGAAPVESSEGPEVVPPAPPPEFAANLKMCAITEKDGAIRVGFVDGGGKPARTYFLFVGESENGYEVMRADYEAETAVVRKDGHEVDLKMGGGGGRLATAAAGAAPQLALIPGVRRPGIARRRPLARSSLTLEQYKTEQEEGRRGVPVSPQQALPQNEGAPDIADLPPELREHAMRKYNLELIRAKGEKGIPLPIPLTEQEDAMLVQEGVLPPQ